MKFVVKLLCLVSAVTGQLTRQELQLQASLSCPAGTTLDPATQSCVEPPQVKCPPAGGIAPQHTRIVGKGCDCPVGLSQVDVRGQNPPIQYACKCSGENQFQSSPRAPFTCAECPQGTTVDPGDPTKCNCPDGQRYNDRERKCECAGANQQQVMDLTSPSFFRCQACPAGQTVNPRNPEECLCPSGQKKNMFELCECASPNQIQSRSAAPFTCRNCPADQTVSQDRLSCECPVGQTFDNRTQKCVCEGANVRQSQLSKPFTCIPCPAGTTIDPRDPTKCNCPRGQTLDLNQQCVCPVSYQIYNTALSKCECPGNQVFQTNPDRCECPVDFQKDPTDEALCIPVRKLPKRPLHDNNDGIESVPGGVDNIKRDTKLQLFSVAPLDRLLNQMNTVDKIRVSVSCYTRRAGDHPGSTPGSGNTPRPQQRTPAQSTDMTFTHEQINLETCHNGKFLTTGAACTIEDNKAQKCPITDDFRVEIFNLANDKEESLGYQIVTREQIQCLGRDKIKIHFEYGKRQELAGAETCFDHTPYITDTGKEDSIPFTVLDICNKANPDRRRCFLYSYQVTLHVTGPIDIKPKLFTKITFKSVTGLVVLPGDQLKTSFQSSYTEQDSVRIMPEIYSPNMPTPIKERYQIEGVTRLPCDDRKVADTIVCNEFFVYCTDPDQTIKLGVQGSGEIMTIDKTCRDFMNQAKIDLPNDPQWQTTNSDWISSNQQTNQLFDWGKMETLLNSDYDKFSKLFNRDQSRLTFQYNNAEVTNKFGQVQQEFVQFELQIGQRLHSEEPRCYQGVFMPPATPTCSFNCQGRECFLRGPSAVNTGKRMLVGSDGRPDVTPPTPGEFEKRFLQVLSGNDQSEAVYVPGYGTPLQIPTRTISTSQYYLPGIKIDNVLKKTVENLVNGGGANRRLLAGNAVIEGEITNGKANLSTGLENQINNLYEFTVKDKLRQDAAPPSAIKIEKLPKHGKIVVTEHDGSTRQLKVGDIISTQLMSNFMYEQGEESCSIQNDTKCSDEFLYSTLSSWVGIGQEAQAQIKLTPVVASASASIPVTDVAPAAQVIDLTPIEEASVEEDTKAPVAGNMTEGPGTCQDFPPAMINTMIGIVATLMLVIVSMGVYYTHAKKQQEGKRTAEDNKDFDSIVENPAAAENEQ